METTNKLPTIADLFEDKIEVAFKNEALNLLLNQEPKKTWIKEHPFINGYKYIPIDKIEFMLRKIFKRYKIEIIREGSSFNGVYVVVRVHYVDIVSGEWLFHDGIGAVQLQTKRGTSPADLININNGAISMAFPIAKTIAIKDACDHFGKLFGCDLNRKDTVTFTLDKEIVNKNVERVNIMITNATTVKQLMSYEKDVTFENRELFTQKMNMLCIK